MTGPGKPQVTFAVSEDPTLIEAVKLDKGVRASIARRVLPCRAGDLYASMSFNDAYRDLLLDHGDSAYEKANGELFEFSRGFDQGAEVSDKCRMADLPAMTPRRIARPGPWP